MNGIGSARMERMAFKNALDGQKKPLENPVLFYRLYGILRTGGEKAAAVSKKRADDRLIDPD